MEMAHFKPLGKKLRLAAATRSNQQIPIWIIGKTLGKVRRKPRRNWRRSRMQL
ncbi:LSU ribosomal protein L39e [Thermofilum adornatum 1505]|jgi:LSU ribosomal protein L39E|uniref:Large ribosomal subunit protein eL39 n=1 Tax=Thermofilum adornatum 1505 TaxID=697581 RepID=A0A3G1A8R4_9CREN|nr:LSU ribosomal protein L39e [Thermofilum adornatum 1505]